MANTISIDSKNFGHQINTLREKLRMTQQEIVDRLKLEYDVSLTVQYLSMIEKGKRTKINEHIYKALIEFYNNNLPVATYETHEVGFNKVEFTDFLDSSLLPIDISPIRLIGNKGNNILDEVKRKEMLASIFCNIKVIIVAEDDAWSGYGIRINDLLLCIPINTKPDSGDMIVYSHEGLMKLGFIQEKNGYLGITDVFNDSLIDFLNLNIKDLIGCCKFIVKRSTKIRDFILQQEQQLRIYSPKQLIDELARKKGVSLEMMRD